MANSELDSDFVLFKSRFLRSKGPQYVIASYQRALKLNQKNGFVYSKWAEMLMEEHRYIESNKIYGLAVTFARNPHRLCFDWIESLYEARRFQDILLISEKFIDKIKEPTLLKNTCGMCYIHLGEYEKALEAFKEVDQLDSRIRVCHLNQVLALYLQKEYTKAVRKFEETEDLTRFETIYQREVTWLEKDLEKEENDQIKEKIKFKLRGFNQMLVLLYKRKSENKS